MLQRLETSARNGPKRTFAVSLNTETTPPGCLVPNNVHAPFQAEPLSIIHFQSTFLRYGDPENGQKSVQ